MSCTLGEMHKVCGYLYLIRKLLFSQDAQCSVLGGKLTFNNLKMSNFPWVSSTPSWDKPLIAIVALQKKHNKKGGLPFSFHHKKTTKGKFQLQMIICEKGLEQGSRPVSFMVRVIAILTTKVAFVISLQATGENNCHPLCHNVIVFKVKIILNG